MRNLTEANVTEAVAEKFAATPNPRLQQIMTSLVRHLHAFVREVELTEAEWFQGIQFLTETGQICDARRQEFILLSDTLGISILVDAINHRKTSGATESSLFGPFFREGAFAVPEGGNIALTPGEPALIHGHVRTSAGTPIAGAHIEVWQTAANGMYESQDPHQPESNLRGKLRSNADGYYAFRTIRPTSYPIPTDGPVGKMLQTTRRHPYRPGHVHFMISAAGYEKLITELFTEGDPYLDSDAVFGVKSSLVVEYRRNTSAQDAQRWGFSAPFWEVRYDFCLQPAVG